MQERSPLDNLNGQENITLVENGNRPYQRLNTIFLVGLSIPISDMDELDQLVRDSEFMIMENTMDINCFDE